MRSHPNVERRAVVSVTRSKRTSNISCVCGNASGATVTRSASCGGVVAERAPLLGDAVEDERPLGRAGDGEDGVGAGRERRAGDADGRGERDRGRLVGPEPPHLPEGHEGRRVGPEDGALAHARPAVGERDVGRADGLPDERVGAGADGVAGARLGAGGRRGKRQGEKKGEQSAWNGGGVGRTDPERRKDSAARSTPRPARGASRTDGERPRRRTRGRAYQRRMRFSGATYIGSPGCTLKAE